jgi:hypothetical protein
MKKPLYVCLTCGQDFTRKYSIYRHTKNIHFGTAQTVRFFEHVIQRSIGKYLPSNPSPFRLKRRQNAFTNNAANEQLLTPFCPPEFARNVITALIRWASVEFRDRLPNCDRLGSCGCSSPAQCITLRFAVRPNEGSR